MFIIKVIRILLLFLWTLIMVAASLPNRLRGWKGRKATSELTSIWAKGMARIAGIKIKVSGQISDLPSALIVSNHIGYIDIVVHATIFPLRFTPSTDVAKIPVVGFVTAMSNAIFVNRKSAPAARKAVRDFTKTMRKGMYLIVYPEGTSTSGKSGILPFKSTPFDAAAEGDMPILPILTRYREKPGVPTVAWYGDMTFFSHLWGVLGLRSIEAEVRFLEAIFPKKRTRKELAAVTHEAMSSEWNKWEDKR
jgi:lyso-ornithine lipid O-acyltransferase